MKHRIETALVTDSYRPSKGRYSANDFDGYRAAPLLIVGEHVDPELVDSQDQLAWRMADAAYGETLKIAKEAVALFVVRSTVGRMQQREGLNGISYLHRANVTPRLDTVDGVEPSLVLEACEKALRGEGAPYQNHLARRAFGMMSIELANLTIFHQFRAQLEAPMWEEIGQLVGCDATPRSEQMYKLKVLGFDRMPADSQHLGAIRVSMKRKIGFTDDGGLVKARTTAIINASPSSGFDQSIVQQIREVNKEDGPDNYDRIADIPEFQQAVAHLIDTAAASGATIARNETVYEDARFVA